MGNSKSTVEVPHIEQPPVPEAIEPAWGAVPTEIPEDEKKDDDLVLQSWAFCKAKPAAVKYARSDQEERARRESAKWRKRSSFIELDCGEDSFFVSNTYKTIGVADGVGGWRDFDIDPAHFSNSLMENAKLFSETHRKEDNPEIIMQAAYDKVLRDKHVKAGSSTALIATLKKEAGRTYLDVANLGDSGLLVIRDRNVLFRVHEMVHGFNAPYQLSILPSQMKNSFHDNVADAVREKIEVNKGDVIVAGTDGLFDNRFNVQIAEDAGWVGTTSSSVISKIPFISSMMSIAFAHYDKEVDYIDPYRVASRIVHDAYKNSLSKDADTPWSSLLRQVGVEDAKGGKVDDITVLIARVTTREEMNMATQW